MVVIAIIGLLSSIVLASLNTAREKARIGAGRQFEANVYHAEGDMLVGDWEFGECSGTLTKDLSGNGNDGVFSSTPPTWSTDTPSGAGCSLSFNGGSQYVNIGNNNSLALTNTFTISAWIKIINRPSGWYIVISGGGNDLGFGVASNQKITLTKVGTIDAPTSNVIVSTNFWHQIAVVFVNGTVTYYLDGQSDGSGSFPQTFVSGQKYIGYNPMGANFYGNIDSVRIFAKDFTASEVQKLYASESGKFKNLAENR